MCGLVGAVGAFIPDSKVNAAVAALAHRGPDGSGRFEAPGVSLAHTRLAVIDPTTGSDQPMVDEATGCALVFNGEIYNYRELRVELEARGHRFKTAGDTEVLLRSFLEWGRDCVSHLNGMFAFAVWDPREQSVFLARDRLGEKPLHFCETRDAVWFASELKALVAADAAARRADPDYLFAFLAAGDLGHPTRTALAGVWQLAPGHAARIGVVDRTVYTWPYWELPDFRRPTEQLPFEEFASLLEDSIRLRLRSDVPLGTSLSGGLDSSLVLAEVRRAQPSGELHAFTASFPGSPMDELGRAEVVAQRLGASIHPVFLTADELAEGLDAMILANEGPVESPSTFAQFCVMREARQQSITVLLDGQGADETWGGYEKYAGLSLLDEVTTLHPRRAWRRARDWRAIHGAAPAPELSRFTLFTSSPAGRTRLSRLGVRLTASWLGARFRAAHADFDPLASIDSARAFGRAADTAAELDLTRVTLPRLLRYADRNSMAWSREVRLPFLDHRLVELAARIPYHLKLVHGWTKEPVRRELETSGLPEVARRRDKLAYMPPTDEWLRHPVLVDRTREAWDHLYSNGYLRAPEPPNATLPRWRVLAVDVWSKAMDVELPSY